MNKNQFFKIAGVKSEKEFYKKYPSEEAFMKVHGKEFKKAKLKTAMIRKAESGIGIGSYTGSEKTQRFAPISYNELYNEQDYITTGSTQQMRDEKAYRERMANSQANDGGGGGFDMKQLQGLFGGKGKGKTTEVAADTFTGGGSEAGALTDLASSFAKNGRKIKKAQKGDQETMCPSGFKYDENSQQCLPDFSLPIPDKKNSAATPDNVGEYTEVPKFNVDQNLSTGTPKTGPGTGVNPPDDTYTAAQKEKSRTKNIDRVMKYTGIAGSIYKGIKMLNEEKQRKREANQQAVVSDATLKATMSYNPNENKRKYVRPEDALIQPNQMFPTYGVGTNVLAKDGARIGGNMTEIQNMYNPGNLYSDLGYEPLSDSEIVKQYRAGGLVPVAKSGNNISTFDAGGEIGHEAGYQIGSAAGKATGIPFLDKVLGEAVGLQGRIVGDFLDKNPEKTRAFQNQTRQNLQQAALYSGAQGIHAQHSAHVKNGGNIPTYEEGGWMSNDWMPQVISQFDGVPIKSLLTKDPMMDTLRTGGHITQNNMYPQDRYALGGELKTTWGGHTETMSHNPYLPGTGETVMFRGKSHEESDGRGHTGIGVKYGEGGHDSYTDYAEYGSENADADVEVERGEPAAEMIDPQTGEKNMVVFGNLKVPKQFIPEANGKKFKNYVKDLSKKEEKQNKIKEKAITNLDNLDDYSPIGLLKQNSYKANFIGSDMKQQMIADNKTNASIIQNAINETAKEHGIDADALAKGKIKTDKKAMKEQAKYGKNIFKAQLGTLYPRVAASDYNRLAALYDVAEKSKKGEDVENFQREYYKVAPEYAESIIRNERPSNLAKKMGYKTKADLQNLSREELFKTNNDVFGDRTKKFFTSLRTKPTVEKIPIKSESKFDPTKIIPRKGPASAKMPDVKPLEAPWWMGLANQAIDYLTPTDQEGFDYSQLYPEMMAASMNQLEPVPAQTYNPQLLTPYDISLQDQLNEVTAQARAAERMARNNPAAAAPILTAASNAKNEILGRQFRENQANKMGIYNQNIATLNDAQLKNLAIRDNQYERQAKAKSNTKAQALEIAKSMTDKIAKQKLENRTLGIYENLYKFRFDKKGRAYNVNPLVQFDVARGGSGKSGGGGIAPGYEFTYDASGNIIGTRKSKDEKDARNGSIVKAIKNL
jgi:hypothetical protein